MTPTAHRPAVVVTALAATTPLAADVEGTWAALLNGNSGIVPIADRMMAEFPLPVSIGGLIQEEFDSQLSRVEVRRLSYMQKMALLLSRRLWEAAGTPEVDTRRLLVSVSHAYGSTLDLWTGYEEFKSRGLRAISPLAVQMHMPNAPAAAVGLDRKAKAGVIAPTSGDASGAAAIAEAWRLIVLGEADVAICGGVESRIEPLPIAAFDNMGLLSHRNDDPVGACRPFDKDRDGMVFGEGGALLLLETEEHAKARGATILGRLLGVGTTSDTHDLIKPDPDGQLAAAALTRALELAGVEPGEVDAVIAHAAGTRLGDLAEARALRTVLGSHRPAVTAPKAALGHAMGASGAIAAALAVQTLRDGVMAPTLNLRTPDPEIELDVVAGERRTGEYRHAASTTLGFGGHNVALVFGAA
ncbi:beta-ketoacyl-ACP synthase [Mycolicibacterium sp. 018/SC-01/001]|uniref:KasA/KasB family beta-ketoacyl-ACP synthase n=1 Tax=Mycolicibacterium sp. 018/SC-01/001 TaxID=2592069 RepID=UPI0011802D95|nr:KasA/KasB family beta-ketoacyl-ACP synthase [Mycolicibacterium sp. 018/SC-01/001]TRW89025.1 beta-ketoacyl-ACP synthase [Mycolicibacterium sp. 018/SC-01/001]